MRKKYQHYLQDDSIIEIQPSVCFLEYYIAKRYSKNVKVYVETARGEYLVSHKPDNRAFSSNVVDNENVFEQLGYFNALGNGTWFDKYNDVIDLRGYIEAHFPIIT